MNLFLRQRIAALYSPTPVTLYMAEIILFTAPAWERLERTTAKHYWNHSKHYYICYLKSWDIGMGADSPAALSHLAQLLFFEGIRNLSNGSFTANVPGTSVPLSWKRNLRLPDFQALPFPHTASPSSCRHCCSSPVLAQYC